MTEAALQQGTPLSLVQKLIEVYRKVEYVEKKGTNTAQNYKYVKASDLAHSVRNALQEVGVYAEMSFKTERTYLIERGLDANKNPKAPMQAVDVRCDIRFIDSDSAEKLYSSGLGSGADAGDKAIFKAQTGALKYALRNAFLVPDDADPEADESTDRAVEHKDTPTHAARPTSPPPARQAPPKAEIPNSASVSSLEPMPNATQTAPSTAYDLSEEDRQPFYKRLSDLSEELGKAGLAASRGLPIKRKVLNYLFATTGTNAVESISRVKWNSFFDVISLTRQADGNLNGVIKVIGEVEANKKTEEKKA